MYTCYAAVVLLASALLLAQWSFHAGVSFVEHPGYTNVCLIAGLVGVFQCLLF